MIFTMLRYNCWRSECTSSYQWCISCIYNTFILFSSLLPHAPLTALSPLPYPLFPFLIFHHTHTHTHTQSIKYPKSGVFAAGDIVEHYPGKYTMCVLLSYGPPTLLDKCNYTLLPSLLIFISLPLYFMSCHTSCGQCFY